MSDSFQRAPFLAGDGDVAILALGEPGRPRPCTPVGIQAMLIHYEVPVAGGLDGARLQLRTRHASFTTWEVDDGRWRLLGYNDASRLAVLESAG